MSRMREDMSRMMEDISKMRNEMISMCHIFQEVKEKKNDTREMLDYVAEEEKKLMREARRRKEDVDKRSGKKRMVHPVKRKGLRPLENKDQVYKVHK